MPSRLDTSIANSDTTEDHHPNQHMWLSQGVTDFGLNVRDFAPEGVTLPGTVAENEAAFAAALAALPSTGGKILIPPGDWQGSFPPITQNERIYIDARGATLIPENGNVAFTVSQGVASNVDGVIIDGARVEGTAGDVTAFLIEDSNNAHLIAPVVDSCAVGIDIHANVAGQFCEGTHVYAPLIRGCQVGIRFRNTAGTNSFAQTVIDNFKIVVGGTNGQGIVVPQSAVLQRSYVTGTVWISDNEEGCNIDGIMEDAYWRIAIEGLGGSSGNVGFVFGANIANGDQWDLALLFTGAMEDQVTVAGSPTINYDAGGGLWTQLSGNAALYYRRHGDTTPRLAIRLLTAGPMLEFGSGAVARDFEIHRISADVGGTADSWHVIGSAAKIGYGTGAGGAVTQITSAATGVTLNRPTGQITTVALTTAAGAEEEFTVTNSVIEATDVIGLSTTYAGAGTPMLSVKGVAAGSFKIVITNVHASNALNALMVINFAVLRGIAA